jgi:hypothetical protein
MQELLQNIQAKAGISEQQALVAVNTTKDYIKSKVPPMFTGMVDQFFSGHFDAAAAMKNAQSQQSDFMNKAKDAMSGAGEKIQDLTKDAIDKSADFAKQATDHLHEWAKQAGGWSEEALNKFKDMFGGQKQSGQNSSGDAAGAGNQSSR